MREEVRNEMLMLVLTKRASLVLVEPKTGRTHQVRRHMKAIGHQVIGDTRYGDANKDARLLGDEDGLGLMLHAWRYRHGGDVPLLPRDVVARCPERIREVCAGVGIDADAVLGDLLAQPLPVR